MSEAGGKGSRGWLAAVLAGGAGGAALTLALLSLSPPEWFASRMVRDGLIAQPEILNEAIQELRDREFAPVIDSHRAALQTPFASSWRGASDPDVVLVEFFDYACPYCRASNPHVDQLLKEEKGLRVVYRELPILGPNSLDAARISLAASKAGRFAQFHDAMYDAGRPSPETIAAAARKAQVALPVQEDAAIEAEIRRNYQLANQFGQLGTPLFIVGDRVLSGAVGLEALRQAVRDARKRG